MFKKNYKAKLSTSPILKIIKSIKIIFKNKNKFFFEKNQKNKK
jgi:hypothetical protein